MKLNIIFCFSLIVFHANARIFNLSESEDRTHLAWVNIEILNALENEEISLDQFTQEVVDEIVSYAQDFSGCNFTSDSEEECKFNQYMKLFKLTYHVPLSNCYAEEEDCSRGVSRLHDFGTVITSELGKIDYNLNKIFQEQHYLSELSLFRPEIFNKLSDIVSEFRDHEANNTSHPYCEVIYLGGDQSDPASYNMLNYNQALCFGDENNDIDLLWNLSRYESLLDAVSSSESQELNTHFKINHLNKAYTELIKNVLGEELSDQILLMYLQQDYLIKPGTRLDFRKDMIRNALATFIYEHVYKAKDLSANLSAIRDVFGLVTYDGIQGVHIYKDKNILKSVFEVTKLVGQKPDRFVNYISENNLSDIFLDTNTSEESSRLEPIDLVSNMIYRLKTMEKSSELKVPSSYKDYAKSYVLSLLGLATGPDLLIFPRSAKDSAPAFECFKASLKSDESDHHIVEESSIFYISELNFQYHNIDSLSLSLTCGAIPFQIEVTRKKDRSLISPESFKIDDGYVDIILPFSLTGEMNESFKKMARTYYSMLGFDIEVAQVENTKASVLSKLSTADVFIPVGHALSTRDLSLGKKSSELWIMKRKAQGDDPYGLRIYIYLPTSAPSTSDFLRLNELSEMYHQRMLLGKDPLFVFVQTCHGEENLPIWSLIYRNAVRNGIEDNGSMPYVIASKRGFPTSSNVEIAGSVLYPTDLSEMLAKGKHPLEVNNYLKTRNYGMLSEELIKTFVNRGLPEIMVRSAVKSFLGDKDVKVSNFEPTFNLDSENREMTLNNAGVHYRVTKEDNQVVLDETY